MITSFVDGRVRLRHPALKETANADILLDKLRGHSAVKNIDYAALTGSVLVEYAPELLEVEELYDLICEFEECFTDGKKEHSSGAGFSFSSFIPVKGSETLSAALRLLPRKQEVKLLNTTLALCLLGLVGPMALHRWAGGAFALLAAAHVARRR